MRFVVAVNEIRLGFVRIGTACESSRSIRVTDFADVMPGNDEIEVVLAGVFQGVSESKVPIAAAARIGRFSAAVSVHIVD